MSAVAFADQIKKLEALRHGQADTATLDQFDEETEQLILRTFGDATKHLEAYGLATMGEAESIVNIPQPAQEDAVQDLPLKAIEQRRQVLEACLAELDWNAGPQKPPQPLRAPAKKKKARAAKKKSAAMKKKAAAVKKKKPAGAGKKKAGPAKKRRPRGRKRR
jgi:hypothetical protein